MKNKFGVFYDIAKTVIGCAIFALGLDLFLLPNHLNSGGISGLSMILVKVLDFASVGTWSLLINLPLFAIGGLKIGKKFFWGSLLGMICLSVFIDLFALLPSIQSDPVMGAIYGGVICGVGGGLVFSTGHSTGGSDIVVRLMKKKWPFLPLGFFTTAFDLAVAVLTGVVFGNVNLVLYCGVSVFVTGRVVDAVLYRFDYSKVALIVTQKHEEVAKRLGDELHRGATFLEGEGSYSHQKTKVVLTAVKQHQITEMKDIVAQIDPDAFVIVQEAHQVLGDGFAHYSKDAL